MEDQTHLNSFNFHYCTDNNWDQMMDTLRGNNAIADPTITSYQGNAYNGIIADGGFCPTSEDLFQFNSASTSDPNSFLDGLQLSTEDIEVNQGDDSTATTMAPSTDRSKTLILERKRRGRMKEKLYALRSLVPNITKMDKASIVGDAVMYVQQMQKQAKKLRAEIAGLESSLKGRPDRFHALVDQTRVVQNKRPSICRKVVQMDVFQVEERGFYVRMVCTKGEGVVVALYKALESLACFNMQSSNLAALPERFLLTFTLHVREEEEMNISTLKLWLMGSLLSQGFEFETPTP